jgi:hypothetical protein
LGDREMNQADEIHVQISGASCSGQVTTTELRRQSGSWPLDPVAPASVWTDDNQLVVELHKLLHLDEDVAIFESYALTSRTPAIGGPYRMFSWWSPDQFRAATDPLVEWRKGVYDRGDHTHCLLTWATIYDGEAAYQEGSNMEWITVDAFEKYIRDDVLRLRRVNDF